LSEIALALAHAAKRFRSRHGDVGRKAFAEVCASIDERAAAHLERVASPALATYLADVHVELARLVR
jgi:hypothetical protein